MLLVNCKKKICGFVSVNPEVTIFMGWNHTWKDAKCDSSSIAQVALV